MPTDRGFAAYKSVGHEWITIMETEFYPDSLALAIVTYGAPIERFTKLVGEASDSQDLLRRISEEPNPMRTQLLRIFRKYVSPDTPVEMLKHKTKVNAIISNFGSRFRDLAEVNENLASRPDPDEAIVAVLHEHANRGQKGYDLTEAFFLWFQDKFGTKFDIKGPTGAGRDVMLNEVLPNFGRRVPADFFIVGKNGVPVAVGFARYDSDRGGAQEDDRTGGNRDKAKIMRTYCESSRSRIRTIFLNDGPGLLLGSMWDDYAELESDGDGQVMVCTLRMLDERLLPWLDSA